MIQETLQAIEEAKNKTGNTDQEVLFGGLEEKLKELASLAQTEADGETSGSSKDVDLVIRIRINRWKMFS